MHKNIKYSDLSKIQSRYVRRESDVMKSQIKLLDNKTWHYGIQEYVFKNQILKNCIRQRYNYYFVDTVNNKAE